jgi:hypothetical protein
MKSPVEFEAILAGRAAETASTEERLETRLKDRPRDSITDRVAPDTGPMTGSHTYKQPATIRGGLESVRVVE